MESNKNLKDNFGTTGNQPKPTTSPTGNQPGPIGNQPRPMSSPTGTTDTPGTTGTSGPQTASAPQRAREEGSSGIQSAVDTTKQAVSTAYDKTSQVLSDTYDQAMSYGKENPGKLTLIAFGAGIGIGLLLSSTLGGGRSRTSRIAEPVVNALSQVALEFFR